MRKAPLADWILLGLAVIFLAALAVAILGHIVSPWIGAGYAYTSVLALGAYGWDKRRARLQGWRLPESTLHLLELLGGWPGALIAQRLFRHKTRKLPFQIAFWLIVGAHLEAWAWWLSQRS